jgi:hypothetical protein
MSAGQIRASLQPQFTSAGPRSAAEDMAGIGGAPMVDEAGLNAAVQAQLAQQDQRRTIQPVGGPQPGGDYGSLLKPFTGADVATDPGYQFGLSEGMKGLDSSAAARGGLFSGAQMKAAGRYANDYATTKFGEAFNRDQITKGSIFGKLSGVAGTGQTATNQVDTAGANLALNQGRNLIGAGDARGTNYLVGANQISNGFNSYLARPQPGYDQTPYVPVGLNYQQGDGW